MKHLFITIVMAAAMAFLAIFGCVAQERVAQAYTKLANAIEKDFTVMDKNIEYHDINSGEVTGVCIVKQFSMPVKKEALIKDFTRAMSQESDNAYHIASGKAGSSGVTYAIAYGTGKNDFELVGADNSMNFMVVCYKDKSLADFRTSYAIEWKHDDDNRLTGKVYKIFGKKPGDYQSSKMLSYKDNKINGFDFNIDSLIDLKSMNELGAKLKVLGNKLGNGYSVKIYSNDDSDLESETNGNVAWLTEFAMLCNKFKEKAKQSTSKGTVYAAELLKMCKNANGVITEGEKKLCIKSLKECQKATSDTFVTGLLDEAINWLTGKNKTQSNLLPTRPHKYLIA